MSRAKATILCIDDHWSGLIGRKIFLEQSGYEVLEATGWDDGLRLFRSRIIDAVVLDYQMPGMRGDVVAAKMKSINSRVPIMLLSAYGPLPANKLKSVDTFLSKSQPPNILLSSLKGLLEGQHNRFSRAGSTTGRAATRESPIEALETDPSPNLHPPVLVAAHRQQWTSLPGVPRLWRRLRVRLEWNETHESGTQRARARQ